MTKKSIICASILLLLTIISYGQNEKVAVGIQYQTFTYGLSVKYNVDENSTVQATVNPVSFSAANLNFYGARYYYNFPQSNSKITPYLFAGAGLITYKYALSSMTGGILNDVSGSFLGYSAGGGISGRLGTNLELSGDAGFGKLNFVEGLSVSGINLGIGLHYYIN
jgi:hypothetical protein